MPYIGVWLLLFAVTALFNVLPNPLSVLTVSCPAFLYVVPVAVYTHLGQWRRSIGLVAGSLLAALAGGTALLAILSSMGYTPGLQLSSGQFVGLVAMSSANAVLVAAVGVVVGVGTARGWTYGRVVSATAAAFCALTGAYLATSWEAFGRIIESMIAGIVEQLNARVAEFGQDVVDEQIASMQWLGENKFALAAGIEFSVYLAIACLAVSATTVVLRRRFADPGPIGSFRDMHPPDWLVWAAILTAALWFAEREYGGDGLRIVTWNAAVALGSVYFLNGCAIFVYGLQVLAPGPFLTVLVVFTILMSSMYYTFSFLGLFDTWANFRGRMDRLAEAIRNARQGES